jgi:two-component sensor histidine kinase
MTTSPEDPSGGEAVPTAIVRLRRQLASSQRSVERSRRSAAQLRRQNRALAALARSAAIDQGDLPVAFAEITEAASRTLGVERVGIWLFDAERTALHSEDLYEATPATHSRGTELTAADYPRYFAALRDQRALAVQDALRDPRTAEFADSYLVPCRIASMMDAPVMMGQRMIGVICHEHVGSPRHWSLQEQMFAGSMSDFVSIAIRARERRHVEQRIADSEHQLAAAQRLAKLGSWEEDLATRRLRWSDELYRIMGFEPGAFVPRADSFLARVVAADRAATAQRIDAMLARADSFEIDFAIELPGGAVRFVAAQGRVERDEEGRSKRLVGTAQDVTDRKRTAILRESRAEAFEQLARGAPLRDVLETLLRGVERLDPRMLCSILLLGVDRRLRLGAAPSLPATYNAAIDGVKIGPQVGSCGAAAATGARVVVTDVTVHPNWIGFRDAAAAAGLRACWSEPIRSSVGDVIGTFAIYYREPRAPDDAALEIIASTAPAAAMVIERRTAEERQQLLMRELDHRVKNTLANVLAIAEQTAAESTSIESLARSLGERIRAMAIAHELLAGSRWEGAELREMIARILGPHAKRGDDRVRLEGDEVILPVALAPTMCMVLHELATNAARHGALSMAGGCVTVGWSVRGHLLALDWTERGGPPVAPPSHRGFGTRLIEQMLAYQSRGASELSYDPAGVRCRIEVSLASQV